MVSSQTETVLTDRNPCPQIERCGEWGIMPLPGHRLLAQVSLPYFTLGAVSMDFAGENKYPQNVQGGAEYIQKRD